MMLVQIAARCSWLIALSFLAPAAPATPSQERAPIYDETADAKAAVDAALRRAKKENKRVLLQWGANWCGWCHLLHEAFTADAAVAKELRYEYEVVLIDIGKWDKNMDLATGYGADLKSAGVPYLTVLDAAGKVVANQATGPFELDGRHDPAKVAGFLKEHEAEPWKAEELLAAATANAKANGKQVFLHFGAVWCGWCHRLEAWMERPAVAPLLAERFVDLKIDTERTIGGQELLERLGGGEGGIPWFVVLDGDGKPMVDSGRKDANLGCPWTDQEIERFGALLGRVGFSREAVTTLTGELVAYRRELEKPAPAGS